MEIAIFPYTHTDNAYQLIEENVFQSSFPKHITFLVNIGQYCLTGTKDMETIQPGMLMEELRV